MSVSSPSLSERRRDNTFCRICYSFSSHDLIPMPCKCRSTIGHVHRRCLGNWIVAVRKNVCEICHSRYDEDVVMIQRRSFKTMLCTFIGGPLPAIFKFSITATCLIGIAFFLCQKLFIIYEPFEQVMVDAGDITNFRTSPYLDTAILVPSIMSYIHLAKLSFLSFRELLSTLHNWWNHHDGNSGQFSFQISNVYHDDDNSEQQLSGATSSELTVALLNVS